jgi:thiol-disulfide isomerase/thioredoxin
MDNQNIMNKLNNSFFLLAIGSLVAIGSINTIVKMSNANTLHQNKQVIAQAMRTPLAKELQGKPVIVDIYATWCPGCKNIAPTLSTLKQKYQDKAHFVVFDVTDKKTSQVSQEKADRLGLGEFFAANKSKTSTVAIIDPATGKILKQFQNNPNQGDYTSILDRAIAQAK